MLHAEDLLGFGDRKNSRAFQAGVLLTAASLLLLSIACGSVLLGKPLSGFPCDGHNGEGQAYIVYDIQRYSSIAADPLGCYAGGSLSENQVTIKAHALVYGELHIRRTGMNLAINDQLLRPGETLSWFRWFPAINPWLINTVRWTIEYPQSNASRGGASYAYVTGKIEEGWWPNPLAAIILGVGIWLIVRKGRKRLM